MCRDLRHMEDVLDRLENLAERAKRERLATTDVTERYRDAARRLSVAVAAEAKRRRHRED